MARNRSITEENWLALRDPREMLLHVSRRGRQRTWRLFACACCRRVWHLLSDPRSQAAVEAAERFADDGADAQGLHVAQLLASAVADQTPEDPDRRDGRRQAALACAKAALYNAGDALRAAVHAARAVGLDGVIRLGIPFHSPDAGRATYEFWRDQQAEQRAVVLDLVGPLPFRPKTVDPVWLAGADGSVPRIAQAIRHDRAFEQTPILADALEDAGCSDAELLSHLRGSGPHVRGCWAIDLVTGKE